MKPTNTSYSDSFFASSFFFSCALFFRFNRCLLFLFRFFTTFRASCSCFFFICLRFCMILFTIFA